MISVPRNPYQVRPSRSSTPESYSSFSQLGDLSDLDSYKSNIQAKVNSHHQNQSRLNQHHHISNYTNHQNHRNINQHKHSYENENDSDHHRAPFTISRSYPSNSSLASNDSFKDKRRLPLPPKGHIMYHPSRYKTELCRQWEELGYCEYDERCLFAHGVFELKPLPNRHPKYKTEKCSAFHEQGFCSFGPRCSFIHSKVDPNHLLRNVQAKAPDTPTTQSPEDKENIKENIIAGETDDYFMSDDVQYFNGGDSHRAVNDDVQEFIRGDIQDIIIKDDVRDAIKGDAHNIINGNTQDIITGDADYMIIDDGETGINGNAIIVGGDRLPIFKKICPSTGLAHG